VFEAVNESVHWTPNQNSEANQNRVSDGPTKAESARVNSRRFPLLHGAEGKILDTLAQLRQDRIR
jgi:hypothetical protein